jgi:hypothetical protein
MPKFLVNGLNENSKEKLFFGGIALQAARDRASALKNYFEFSCCSKPVARIQSNMRWRKQKLEKLCWPLNF